MALSSGEGGPEAESLVRRMYESVNPGGTGGAELDGRRQWRRRGEVRVCRTVALRQLSLSLASHARW